MSSFNDAILILKPASYKAGTLYSVKPNAAAGDFTVARASTSTRVNSDLKLEEMAINVPLLSYDRGRMPTFRNPRSLHPTTHLLKRLW
jgi:hypothetical protein